MAIMHDSHDPGQSVNFPDVFDKEAILSARRRRVAWLAALKVPQVAIGERLRISRETVRRDLEAIAADPDAYPPIPVEGCQ